MTQHLSEKTSSNALLTDPASTLAERAATRENDCPFIVRVLHARDLRFLGTAFFVSPTLAIGCLHYLLKDKDPKGRLTGPRIRGDARIPSNFRKYIWLNDLKIPLIWVQNPLLA